MSNTSMDHHGLGFLAMHTGDFIAVISASESLSYQQLRTLVSTTEPTQAAFAATTSLDTLATLLATWRGGGVAYPLNPALPTAAHAPLEAATLALGPGVLVQTSGSSGTPKAAMLPLAALVESARRSNANIPVAPGDRWLLSLPLFHVSGLGVVLRTWLGGGAVALPARGMPLLDAIRELNPTHVSLVATQLRRLMAVPEALTLLRGMKAILLGGSAFPPALIRDAHAAGLPIHKSYGLTEMCSQVCTTRPGADLEELMTAGAPLAPDTVKISDNGEIEVRGATLFRGYVGHAVRYTPNDWFPTGDLGRFDAQGRLVVLGRKDNMYISGGENIHPEDVERVLAGLPDVEQAMVVAVPDAEYGEVGFAFVAMPDGTTFDRDALRAAVRGALPGFKVPKYFQPWPHDLAQTGIKPSRAALRARALDSIREPR